MIRSAMVELGDAPLEIIDGDRGKNYPKQNEFPDSGHCLFLSATNVTRGGFEFSDCQFISEKKDEMLRKGKLRREDVVLTTRGTIGNVAHFHVSVPYEHMRINSGMIILRCNQRKILPAYLYHFLRSTSFRRQVNAMKSGAAQPQLPVRDVKRTKIRLPSLSKQHNISSVLSTYDDLSRTTDGGYGCWSRQRDCSIGSGSCGSGSLGMSESESLAACRTGGKRNR